MVGTSPFYSTRRRPAKEYWPLWRTWHRELQRTPPGATYRELIDAERGRRVRRGTHPEDGLKLTIPDELPYSKGRERIRVFATTFPADLSPWKQDRYRDAGTASAFERRFEAVWRGGTFREAGSEQAPEGEHWTAVTVSFLVHRARV
jgi:hypothetical protein